MRECVDISCTVSTHYLSNTRTGLQSIPHTHMHGAHRRTFWNLLMCVQALAGSQSTFCGGREIMLEDGVLLSREKYV